MKITVKFSMIPDLGKRQIDGSNFSGVARTDLLKQRNEAEKWLYTPLPSIALVFILRPTSHHTPVASGRQWTEENLMGMTSPGGVCSRPPRAIHLWSRARRTGLRFAREKNGPVVGASMNEGYCI